MKLIASNQITLTNVIDGKDGVGHLTTWTFYKLSNSTSAPQVVPIGSSTNLSHLGPNNAWTLYKELSIGSSGWNVIDFDKIAKSSIIPDKPFTWYLEASFDGVSNFNGSTDFNIRFENWYVNSAGSNVYNPLGIKVFQANKFSATNDTAVTNYFSQSITWTVPRAVYDAIPEGGFLNLRIRIDQFTKLLYHAKNSYVTYGTVPSDPAQRGLGNYSTYGWKASPEAVTQSLPYLWIYQIQFYDNSKEVAIPPMLIGAQGVPGKPGADGRTPYIHFAYADDDKGTNFSLTDKNQQYQGYYSDYTQADSTDYTKYKWVDRLANVQIGGENLLTGTRDWSSNIKRWANNNGAWNDEVEDYNNLKVKSTTGGWNGWHQNVFVKAGEYYTLSYYAKSDTNINVKNSLTWVQSPVFEAPVATFDGNNNISDSITTDWERYSRTVKITGDGSLQWRIEYNGNALPNGKWYIAGMKLERGTIATDYTQALEDTQEQIDSKADSALTQEQLNALAEKNNLIKAEMEAKASIDTVNQWISAYQNYVNANNADKARSEQALKDASERILMIKYEVDNLKVVWNAIDTYMSFQNEGLIIGKKDGSAYAKFSDDRISLFSGSSEVMYISQGTLNIANGIFTKTIQIGRFRFETHPADADMLVVRFLGG